MCGGVCQSSRGLFVLHSEGAQRLGPSVSSESRFDKGINPPATSVQSFSSLYRHVDSILETVRILHSTRDYGKCFD